MIDKVNPLRIKRSLLSGAILVAFSLLLLVLLFLPSCKKKTETYVASGEEYCRYAKGQERHYEVDSTYYDWIKDQWKTKKLLVVEKVVDTFTDLSGHIALRIEQQASADSGKTFKFFSLQSIYINAVEYQRVENNQRFVKMIIPVGLKRKWDGNIYNNLGYQEYFYSAVSKPLSSVYGNHWNDCVTVLEQEDTTAVSSIQKLATYARDTGLVYMYDRWIYYDPNNGNKPGDGSHVITWNLRKFWK